MSGSPVASAWAWSISSRTACMATRPADSFTVVSSPAASPRPSERMTCSIHALSLPLLHDTRIFTAGHSLERVGMERMSDEFHPFGDSRPRNHRLLLIEKVDTRISYGRQRYQRAPDVNLFGFDI